MCLRGINAYRLCKSPCVEQDIVATVAVVLLHFIACTIKQDKESDLHLPQPPLTTSPLRTTTTTPSPPNNNKIKEKISLSMKM